MNWISGPRRRSVGIALALVLGLSLFLANSAAAQSGKSFHWTQYDYTVEILDNSDMLFRVDMTFSFDSGSFSQGYFAFETDRMDEVTDVRVYEDGQAYQYVRSEMVGGYTVDHSDKETEILWWFPPTANATRTFTLEYRVLGGLRMYEGGDQLYWDFYAGNRSGRIDNGVISVVLPQPVPLEQIEAAVSPDSVVLRQADDRTIQATVRNLGGYQDVTLRVQFPHGIVTGQPGMWQLEDDRRVQYEESTKPLIEMGVLALSVLMLTGGIAAVVALWYTKGRDYPAGVVAEYLSEPPSSLAPGIVGALVDEKVDVQDILATVVDLGRRGVLRMEEVREPGLLGIGTKSDFVYTRLASDTKMRPFEKKVVNAIFGSKTEVKLSALKIKFYSKIPEISKLMYQELVDQNLFLGNPDTTRRRYRGLGSTGMAVVFVVGMCATFALSQYASNLFCLPLAAMVPFALLAIMGGAMPKKTELGATEAAGWEAFRRYLQDIDKFDDLQERVEIFERYLPYAVALGVEKEYLAKWSKVQAPAPVWYGPVPQVDMPLPRPDMQPTIWPGQGGGTIPVSTGGMGTGSSLPDLQQVSDGLASSIQGMSDGFQSMLNSAASTLTSRPPSSSGSGWSGGGGGGFSGGGGGFSGGGGGGGGSGAR